MGEREAEGDAGRVSPGRRETDSEIVTRLFLAELVHLRQCPLVGAKFAAYVLEELLTDIEQAIANEAWQERKAAEAEKRRRK